MVERVNSSRSVWQRVRRVGALLCGLVAAGGADSASLGWTELAATADDGPVTVYYASDAPERAVKRGRISLSLAEQAVPLRGNGRLVIISHGSGGAPWVHADLARTLVDAGLVVAIPEHQADNYKDESRPGPESGARRPVEVSHAIDAIFVDARFAPLLRLDRVGVYGMSAGAGCDSSMVPAGEMT